MLFEGKLSGGMIMKRTINLSDHRYTTKDFAILEKLPELNERHEDKWQGEWYSYTDITEITNRMASYDDGDGGYYRYYVLEKSWGYLSDPDSTETYIDDKYIAVWESYANEDYPAEEATTYVTIDNLDERYEDIDSAIEAADKMQLETVTINVYDQNGNLLESQDCERNPNSGDLVYTTWGIFGYRYFEGSDEIETSDGLSGSINSKEEAMAEAETIRDRFCRYDLVKLEAYTQTLSENIGDVTESIEVYSSR